GFKQLDKALGDTILQEIDHMIENNPEITVNTAFKYLLGEHADEILKMSREKSQKQVIADMHDKAKRNIKATDSNKGEENIITPRIRQLASEFGVSPKELARKMAKRGRG